MNPAFRHLPHLCGKIRGAEDSGLRITPSVLSAWDQQAREQGLGPSWRLSDEELEASRHNILDQRHKQQDVWIFAYGSLMWDVGLYFSEVRRACLVGHERRFNTWTTIGRGTVKQPGLVLSVEPHKGACHGLAFRIDGPLVEQESQVFWRREMLLGAYCPRFATVSTPQGDIEALVLTANAGHPSWVGDMALEDVASVISHAKGQVGSNLEYLLQLADQLERLEIDDPYVQRLIRCHVLQRKMK